MSPTAKPGTDLVPVDPALYPILAPSADLDALREVVDENIGAGGMTQFDLDRIKIPSGGGRTWLVPGLEGDEDLREIDGIVVYWRDPRAFWRSKLDDSGGGTPPDCASEDGEIGVGDPGGPCATCPYARWGSKGELFGDESRGQACKQMRLLFVLRPESILPVAMPLPPTSIRPVKQFFLRLAQKATPYYGVAISLGLEQDKNAGGIVYSKVVPKLVSVLDADQRAAVKSYRDSIRASLDTVRAEAGDFSDGDVSGGTDPFADAPDLDSAAPSSG